jgi:protein-arginine kinase activator protein McsA
MTDATNAEKCKDGWICSWCGMHFRTATLQKASVCSRCYGLLASAGLKDEEIFAEVKSNKPETAPDE